jgi:CxxC motif-containing protein (DUF1111 family)
LALFCGVSVAVANAPSLREQLLAHPVSEQLGGDTTRPLLAQNAFSFQAANAPRPHQRPFSFGNRLFNTNWVEFPASVKAFDGLGPTFNRVSCSGCHTKDGRGTPPVEGIGPMDSILLRISLPGTSTHGGPKPVPGYGDQLNERAIAGVAAEGTLNITYEESGGSYRDGTPYTLRKPTYRIANGKHGPMPSNALFSPRVAPHMIGLGLLEAVTDETLLALADPEDRNGDDVSGRPNKVWNTQTQTHELGRFGWKAGQPDLLNQNAAAALGDIGLTTSLHPKQNCSEGQQDCATAEADDEPELSDAFLHKLTLYTATLAVPTQRSGDSAGVQAGAKVFRDFGCAACHMPTLKTGNHALPELADQTIHPFTDLLLHDMGPGLADNRSEFEASGAEWRTPPLWGIGLLPRVNGHQNLLHDGRARGIEEAILWHSGEAETAKENFRAAPKTIRNALITFLNSL